MPCMSNGLVNTFLQQPDVISFPSLRLIWSLVNLCRPSWVARQIRRSSSDLEGQTMEMAFQHGLPAHAAMDSDRNDRMASSDSSIIPPWSCGFVCFSVLAANAKVSRSANSKIRALGNLSSEVGWASTRFPHCHALGRWWGVKTRISGQFELSYCTVWILCMGNAAENRCRKNALARFCMSRILVFHWLVFTKISLILSGKAGDSRPQVLMGTVSVSMSSNFCSPRFCEACTERDLFRNGEVTCIQPGNLGALCQISKIRGFIDFVDLIRISKIDAFGNHLDHNIWFILVHMFMPRVRCGAVSMATRAHFTCLSVSRTLRACQRGDGTRFVAYQLFHSCQVVGELCGKMSVQVKAI